MRIPLVLVLLLLLALAGVAWVLFAGDDAIHDEDAFEDLSRPEEALPAPPLVREAPALAGSRAAPTRRRKPRWPVLPTNQIPRGSLDVRLVYEDETPVAANDVRVRLEREGSAFYSPPLGVPDYDTGIWRFDKVVVGWVRVIVVGDHILEAKARARVNTRETEKVELAVKRAGAIAYEVEMYSGERPENVALELRHPETKRPLNVYWQMRTPDRHSSPHRATQVRLGPEGVVFPVPPGRWVLRATSDEGEIDDVDVEVVVGETVKAEVKLRK